MLLRVAACHVACADGQLLWACVNSANVTVIAGAPSGGTWAQPQQAQWSRRELGPDVRLMQCPFRLKAQHSLGAHCVLISSDPRDRDPWVTNGGRFHLHDEVRDTIKFLVDEVKLANVAHFGDFGDVDDVDRSSLSEG